MWHLQIETLRYLMNKAWKTTHMLFPPSHRMCTEDHLSFWAPKICSPPLVACRQKKQTSWGPRECGEKISYKGAERRCLVEVFVLQWKQNLQYLAQTLESPDGIMPSTIRELPPIQASSEQPRVLSQPPLFKSSKRYRGWISWACRLNQLLFISTYIIQKLRNYQGCISIWKWPLSKFKTSLSK